jgi:hypothetical protein
MSVREQVPQRQEARYVTQHFQRSGKVRLADDESVHAAQGGKAVPVVYEQGSDGVARAHHRDGAVPDFHGQGILIAEPSVSAPQSLDDSRKSRIHGSRRKGVKAESGRGRALGLVVAYHSKRQMAVEDQGYRSDDGLSTERHRQHPGRLPARRQKRTVDWQ